MPIYIYNSNIIKYAPLAQLDRVADFESVGRGFESLMVRQKIANANHLLFFFLMRTYCKYKILKYKKIGDEPRFSNNYLKKVTVTE